MALERQQIAFASQHADPSLLVMTVPSEMTAGGISIQAFAVPLDARRGGVLLALPTGLFPLSLTSPTAGFEDEDMIGPSTIIDVDMVDEDDLGNVYAPGFQSSIYVGDFANSVLAMLREYDLVTDSLSDIIPFSEGYPTALPSAPELLSAALSWASSEAGRVHFYSAREEPDPSSKSTPPKKAAAKRVTTAVLAEQVASLSAQVALLTASRPAEPPPQTGGTIPGLPQRSSAIHVPGPSGLAGTNPPKVPPVSHGLSTPARTSPAKALQLIGPPPRTRMSPILALQDEHQEPLKAPPETIENSLSQQSAALTALVSHIIQGGEGLGLEAQGSTGVASSSTRGTIKRDQLQHSLAKGQSSFFLMLQQQICRRLHPSQTIPKTEDEA